MNEVRIADYSIRVPIFDDKGVLIKRSDLDGVSVGHSHMHYRYFFVHQVIESTVNQLTLTPNKFAITHLPTERLLSKRAVFPYLEDAVELARVLADGWGEAWLFEDPLDRPDMVNDFIQSYMRKYHKGYRKQGL